MTRATLAMALVCLPAFSGFAQLSAPPAACVVKGRVVDSLTALPVSGAYVYVRVQSGEKSVPVRHTTDELGRFCFQDLEAGDYTFSAAHTGYLETNYGEKRPGSPGLPLTIADKTVPELSIRLTPQAVISGRLVDADGDPAGDAPVSLLKRAWSNGKIAANPVSETQTDEQGRFRFTQLAAGTYYLDAKRQDDERLSAVRGFLDDKGQPFREREAETFYKGSFSFTGATPITVRTGQIVSQLEVALQRSVTRHISGRLANGVPDGKPPMLWLLHVSDDGDQSVIAGIPVQKDGSFRADGLLAEQYVIEEPGSSANSFARSNVDLTAGDVDGFIFEPQQLLKLQIRIRVEGAKADAVIPAIDQILLVEPKSGSSFGTRRDSQDHFEISGVAPNRYVLHLDDDERQRYFIKRLLIDREAQNGAALDLRHSTAKSVEVVLSSKVCAIAGHVTTAHPLTTGTMIVLEDETDLGGTESQVAGPDGRFEWNSLAPGKYRLYAFEDFDGDLWGSPELATALAAKSVLVVLHEGEKRQIATPLISAEEFQDALRKAGF